MINRYARSYMKEIWSLENKFNKWLLIEVLACEALAKHEIVPNEAAILIKENASFSVERIGELEKETRHDVVAFTRCVAESLGEESRYLHYGLTSSDVVDTALSVLLKESAEQIQSGLKQLEEVLVKQAIRHRNTLIMGRTHGVHAEPTSLGLKFGLWLAEVQRNQTRVENMKEYISVGKISGAVGNYAHLAPFVEEYVCYELGLHPAPVSTQVLQRDSHAEYIFVLALVASTLEKIALEIRNLQRTEIREIEEPFYHGQKGSSAMPHKRNPVSCEQVTGLARVARGNVQAALEDNALWHERDISHSSVERVILPDSSMLVDYLLDQMTRIIKELHVYPENMLKNMEVTNGLIYSQRILLELINSGLTREEAYDYVQDAAMKCWNTGENFQEVLLNDSQIISILGEDKLRECFDPAYFLEKVDYIYQRLGIE